jgi:Mg-chelatase subunit ChlD
VTAVDPLDVAPGEPGDGGDPGDDRLRRWRLLLGGGEADGVDHPLHGLDAKRDEVLADLYDGQRGGGLARSAPRVARWLGDIRTYFPTSVVQVVQRDAIDRLGLKRLLLEPELLDEVTPDVHLAAALVALQKAIPERSREVARRIVRTVVDDLQRRLEAPTRQAVGGALRRSLRTRRPRPGDIDWNRTVAANLRHYQPEHRTVIPERLVGYGRRSPQVQRDIVLAIDQSGSMASSVVYASVFGAVLASLRAVRTRVVAFDTAVVDLSADVADPVELLFGVQLGGGTDIAQALAYCESLVTRPSETVVVLISDLFEGGDRDDLVRRAAGMVERGVQIVALLALADDGAPAFDHEVADLFAGLGIPTFACTPELFPELMAAAIGRQDLATWAAAHDVVLAAPPA